MASLIDGFSNIAVFITKLKHWSLVLKFFFLYSQKRIEMNVKRFKFFIPVIGVLAGLLFLISCEQDDLPPQPLDPEEISNLLDYEYISTRSAGEIRSLLQFADFDLPLEELVYRVNVYKVTYETTYKGNTIEASGLVVLPDTDDPVGIFSFQNGTIVAHSSAFSVTAPNAPTMIFFQAMASPGFIAVLPDYIGFGASTQVLHPYYVEGPSAQVVRDNIRAAKFLAEEIGNNFNGKIFLAGYSEGGYTTMAAHKGIEAKSIPGMELVASFPAAGGYNVKSVQEYFFGRETYSDPFYMAYVAMAYKEFYNWDYEPSDFFQEPYASLIPDLFDGTQDGGQINSQLTEVVADFINPHFLENIDTDPLYNEIVNAFNTNSVHNWTPTRRMYMYHGDQDITVPYFTSIDTFDQFISNGASAETVTFTNLPGTDHGSGFAPYLESFFPILLDLR